MYDTPMSKDILPQVSLLVMITVHLMHSQLLNKSIGGKCVQQARTLYIRNVYLKYDTCVTNKQ